MPDIIYNSERLQVTRFYGGSERGKCYHLQVREHPESIPMYVEMRAADFVDAAHVIIHEYYNPERR